MIDLVEWLLRIPTRSPRKVLVSDVLLGQKILTPYEIAGIQRLQKAIGLGHDLRPFLGDRTRSIRNRSDEKKDARQQNDLFFSDWGLHHFHLGADLANNGRRVGRTRRVLIAHLTATEAYLLDVVAHGKGSPDTWGHKSYLETLERNWPEVLVPYEMKRVLPPQKHGGLSSRDHLDLRRGGVNAMIEINGRAFMGPGLGISTDGSSTKAVRLADKIRDELDAAEKVFRDLKPDDEANLFVAKDGSLGFFNPIENSALSVLPSRHNEYKATEFFRRLMDETGIISEMLDGSIWLPPAATENS